MNNTTKENEYAVKQTIFKKTKLFKKQTIKKNKKKQKWKNFLLI
jgi:hypothetical protein